MRGAWALVLAAAVLAGCVAQGEIQNHVERINKSVGTSRNEAILLNIVRASRNEPLYFTSLPSVTGQGNMSLSTGLPTITFGRARPSPRSSTPSPIRSTTARRAPSMSASSNRGLL